MTINELKVVVDRFEGRFAVLTHGEGELLWPKDKLPGQTKEGDAMVLVLKKDADATKDRAELAKTMLNELLNRDED
jgi:hypothetical protein